MSLTPVQKYAPGRSRTCNLLIRSQIQKGLISPAQPGFTLISIGLRIRSIFFVRSTGPASIPDADALVSNKQVRQSQSTRSVSYSDGVAFIEEELVEVDGGGTAAVVEHIDQVASPLFLIAGGR